VKWLVGLALVAAALWLGRFWLALKLATLIRSRSPSPPTPRTHALVRRLTRYASR
jgi:hypothetical protein